MAKLTEEEKEILYRAHEIRERIRAEELEAGEISLEDAKRQAREEMQAQRTGRNPRSTFTEETSEIEDDANTSGDDALEAEETGSEENSSSGHPGVDFSWEEDAETMDAEKKPKRRRSPSVPPEREGRSGREAEAALAREDRREERRAEKRKEKKHRKKKHGILRRLITFLLVLILIAAAGVGIVYGAVRVMITETNYQPYETAYVRADDVKTDPRVTNILLIGTDNRETDDASRSDAMIVVSINNRKHKLVMTSILRDSYVNIAGYGQNRINHAYQMGGPALLIQTIEENFKIGIDYYVHVDFYSFIDVIDAFGGVDIEVTDAEFQWLNGYVSEINHLEGQPEGYSFLAEPGYQTLNGRQALAYSRIRYDGTDFKRTERQRTVLEALLQKAKKHPLSMIKACRAILPDLTTNISDNEMTKLIMTAPLYMLYSQSQFRVPADNTWWNDIMGSNQEVLGIDFNANNALLQSAIYD